MFNSTALDIVIGLVFIYLLYSFFATIIQEIIATNFGFRSKILERGVRRMLDDGKSDRSRLGGFLALFFERKSRQPELTREFYDHPLIKYLAQDKWHNKPAYLSAQNYSKVIVDLLRGRQSQAGKDHRVEIQAALASKKTGWSNVVINDETLDYLNSMWVDAQGDIEKFKAQIEDWYNETMERASGWYKQYTQVLLLAIGFTIAIIFNVDTFAIVKKLDRDPKLREQLVAQADAFAKAHPNLVTELEKQKAENAALLDSTKKIRSDAEAEAYYKKLKTTRDTLYAQASRLVQTDMDKVNNLLGLGWGNYGGASCWCEKIAFVFVSLFSWSKFFGLLITGIAISMGAPFWFDLLNKLIKIRGNMKGEQTAPESRSKDSKSVPAVERVG